MSVSFLACSLSLSLSLSLCCSQAAFGLASADVVAETLCPAATTLNDDSAGELAHALREAGRGCVARLQNDGFALESIDGG